MSEDGHGVPCLYGRIFALGHEGFFVGSGSGMDDSKWGWRLQMCLMEERRLY